MSAVTENVRWTFSGANGRRPGGVADHVRGPEDYVVVVWHCHVDPVKHGLPERPEGWPYSSIHRHIRAGQWAAKGGVHPAAMRC